MKVPPCRIGDAIVIGSGIGGVAAAAALAKENKRVLVLERHHQLGGRHPVLRAPRVSFDVGVHYVGGAGDVEGEPGPTKEIFDALTPEGIPMASMVACTTASFSGLVVDFEQPRSRLVATP